MAAVHPGVVGSFAHLDSLILAIERLKQAGYRELQALSPVPHHAIDQALEKPPSPVRVFTLVGCLFGAAAGFALTIGATLHYPLIVGGKPILSIPPFLVIVFELTILFGGLLTLGGMLFNARLPRVHVGPAYRPSFSEDRFGLWIGCEEKQYDEVERLLKDAGAEETARGGGA
jgi:molybdopterin-containing oxidoreductase family membrane subunit